MEHRENIPQSPVESGRCSESTLNRQLRVSIGLVDERSALRQQADAIACEKKATFQPIGYYDAFRCLGCGFTGDITLADVERHRATGCLGTTEPFQEIGIDVPGVGRVPAPVGDAIPAHWHAHGLCRNCGKPVRRNAEGLWVHENGVFCEGRFCAAEPIGIAVAHDREYVRGEVPESLRSFIDGERVDLETTPPAANIVALQDMADGESEGLYGEPWRFSVDALDHVRIYASEGTQICEITSQSKVEALEWAERICACANFCAGLPEFDLAVSEPLAKTFPFLRESSPSIQNAIVESLKAARPAAVKWDTPCDWASELECMRCGQRGGEGWVLISQQSHCNRDLLSNECVLQKGGWSYVYVHNCVAPKGGTQ